ncbi:MAG: cupredoxin domain-containing protein [Methanoregula sp.]|nr:cupredoxin domain-containing protein [Methanoregula sp.]
MKCSYLLVFLLALIIVSAGCSQPASQPVSTVTHAVTSVPTTHVRIATTTVPVTVVTTTQTTSTSTTISILDTRFDPDTTTVPLGSIVRWVNADDRPHSVVFTRDSKNIPQIATSGALSAGQSFSVKFAEPGTYLYHCGMHPAIEGTVIVQSS